MKKWVWLFGLFCCLTAAAWADGNGFASSNIEPQTANTSLFGSQAGTQAGNQSPLAANTNNANTNNANNGNANNGTASDVMPASVSDAPNTNPGDLPPLPRPATPEEKQQAAFEKALKNQFSLTPDQIREIKKIANQRAGAEADLPVTPPKAVSGSVSVSLTPDASPPVIRPFINHESSFVVLDSTGAPWPVENFRVGDPRSFKVERLDAASPGGSAFSVNVTSMYAQSNLVLKLVGVSKPIVIDLISGQAELDESVEVRVQGQGPNARIGHRGIAPAIDSRLLPVLDGVPPENSTILTVSGDSGATRAWLSNISRRMIVRTPFKIVSPASTVFISSADGTHVYEMMPTPLLVGIRDGQFINLSVQGW